MMEKVNKIFSNLEGWHKKALIIMGIIIVSQFFMPYVKWVGDYFENSYKVQRDYNAMSERLTNIEEYVEVLNYVVDGIGATRYHRSVRFLLTDGIKQRPEKYEDWNFEYKLRWDLSHCDWYYLVKDSDGIKKWMRAQYSAEFDVFDYIDHDGHHHQIKPLSNSELLKTY